MGQPAPTSNYTSVSAKSFSLLAGIFCLFFPFSVALGQFSVSIEGQAPSCNGYTDGSLNAVISGGQQPFNIAWSTGDTGMAVLGVGAGSYSITVTDANSEMAVDSFLLGEPTAVVASIDFVGSVCINPGDLQAEGSGGAGSYSFEWEDGSTEPVRTGLPPGLYCVTVSDVNDCLGNTCIVVPEPLSLEMVSTPPSCPVGLDGSMAAIAMGGSAPYSYSWNTGDTTSVNSNLLAGSYFVTVIDANGCLAFGAEDIEDGTTDLSLNINAQSPDCPKTGSIAVDPMGGVPPYNYVWSTGDATPVLENLVGNMTYMLTVIDDAGCQMTENIFLELGSDLAIFVTVDYICGMPSGSATANVAGGVPPYSFSWSNGSNQQTAVGLTPGEIYGVTVTDSDGCPINQTIAVADVNQLNVDIEFDVIMPLCNGFCDAFATAIVPGVDPDSLNYIWNTGQLTQTIANLPAGTFMVTVYDDDGCGGAGMVTIDEPDLLEIDLEVTSAVCGVPFSGSATAEITGGTLPYTIIWSSGDDDLDAENLNPGNYSIVVFDANGCEANASFVISNGELDVTVSGTDSDCTGSNGTATATPLDGTAPFEFEWSNGDSTAIITGLTPGAYMVTITDADGCMGVSEQLVIGTAGGPSCTVEITSQISSPGANDGELTVEITGGVGPFIIEWSDGQTGMTAIGLAPGTYSVTVIDANLCQTECQNTLVEEPCVAVSNPGAIGFDQVLCGPGNDPDPLVNVELPSGGSGGEIEYLWMQTTTAGPFDPSTWVPIPNSNSPNYDPPPLFVTTYFARCARIEDCGSFVETDIVVIEVQDVAVAEIIPPALPVCVNDLVSFDALDNGPDATYEWFFGGGAVPQISNEKNPSVHWISLGVRTISLTVTNDTCTSVAYMNVTVTTGPALCGFNLVIDTEANSQGQVMVSWEMEADLGPFEYEVERSADGATFEEVGKVIEPMETGNPRNFYQFLDLKPKYGKSYYRVKFKDDYDEMVYSNMVEMNLTPKEGEHLLVYPNPFNQHFVIELLDGKYLPEEITLDIRSASGALIKKVNLNEGEERKVVEMDLYPAGVYFVRIFAGDKNVKTIRLINLY